ncbi:MAG: hypothetical protein QXS38_01210 [Candidatus Pacearchaeota archaeon]
MNLDEAIRLVREKCPNEYARRYAEAIPFAVSRDGTKGLCSQVYYILANAKNWRGKKANEAKEVMRNYLQAYKKPQTYPRICL